MKIKNFIPRLYQENISDTALKRNTLVVLPTGLGKTKIAILTSIKRLNLFPNSKILFLTPTKPLADQIKKEFIESTDIKNITTFTGEVSPEKRCEMWKNSKIIISTPQCTTNDIANNRMDFSDVSLIIFDEAHRATGDYDYKWIAKMYVKSATYPRMLALTASPGSDFEAITTICKNLYIEDIETRTEEDEDVATYVKETNIDWIKVDLPDEFKNIQMSLKKSFESKLKMIKNLNKIKNMSPNKKELLLLLSTLQGRLARGEKNFQVMRAVSLLAEAIKISHAIELLETQNINTLLKYFEKIWKESATTKTKAIKNLVKDPDFQIAYENAKKIKGKIEHPKLTELKKIVQKESKTQNVKIIIFTQFRDNAVNIETELKKIENVKAKIFIGQAKRTESGLSQKEQLQIIDDFKKNKINIIISTSIGEEGLDIPAVDMVIFFEPIPSAIRTIQRRGRTARQKEGKVIVLMTKNTRDEIYYWVSHHKEKNMRNILKSLKNKIKLKEMKLEDFDLKREIKEPEEIKIYADNREGKSIIIKELKDHGLNIETKNLDIADYIISTNIGIERKTIQDFVSSIIDKRLLFQLRNLRENFENPLLILEGEEDIFSIRKIHPNAIYGMLAAITISYNIPVLYTKNPKETAALIRIIAKREQENKNKDFGLRIEKKPLTTKELQEYIVQSLPGVGPSLSKSLLAEFKTIKKIVNASEEELKKIEKLGNKKSSDIKDIIETVYQE